MTEQDERMAIARALDTLGNFAEFYGVSGDVADLVDALVDDRTRPATAPNVYQNEAEYARKRAWVIARARGSAA